MVCSIGRVVCVTLAGLTKNTLISNNGPPLPPQTTTTAQGDTVLGQVSRADVAAVCIAALSSDATKNTTFELVNVKATGSQPPTNTAAAFATLFEGLKRD